MTDIVGPFNVLIPAAFTSGTLALCWIGIKNEAGMIIFAILYGFFSGGFVSLPPVALVYLTTDMRKLGTRMGQCFFVSSLGLLVGSPVAGAILGDTGSWVGLQVFSGAMLLVTGAILVAARVSQVGWSITTRA